MSHRWFFLKANLDITLENIQHMPDDHSSVNLCGWLQIICQHLNTILILTYRHQFKAKWLGGGTYCPNAPDDFLQGMWAWRGHVEISEFVGEQLTSLC